MENSPPKNSSSFSKDIIPLSDQFLLDDENLCLDLPEFPPVNEPSLGNWLVPKLPPADDEILLPPIDYPLQLQDQFIFDMINEPSGDIPQNHHHHHHEASGNESGKNFVQEENLNKSQDIPESSGFGNPVKILNWPIIPSPYNCSCCQVLREIIHTNGKQMRKFEIHGRVGMFSHGILEKFDFELPENREYQMFDFCNETTANVKDFLIQYCEDLKREDYQMIKDPFSNFYEALSIGINDDKDNISNSDNVLQSSAMSGQQDGLTRSDSELMGQSQDGAEKNGAGSSRSKFAAQRERTGKMKLQDFSEHIDLRISDVAKKMNVCPSVIKKKCREAGLPRWPYRKVNGIKKKLAEKRRILTTCKDAEKPRILVEIEMLDQQLKDIFAQYNSINTS